MGNKVSGKKKKKTKKGAKNDNAPAASNGGAAATAKNDSNAQRAPKNSIDVIKSNERIGRILKHVPLLAKLTDAERAKLGGALNERSFRNGESIIKQGDVGEGFFIINSGEVVVLREEASGGGGGDEESKAVELGRLKAGDYFGETALLTSAPRGATVNAIGDVSCFYLGRRQFDSLFSKKRLNIRFAKRQAVSAEKMSDRALEYTPKMPAGATKEKTERQFNSIRRAVQDNILFMDLDSSHQRQVISEMYQTKIEAGTSLIKQGDMGDNFYVVESGEFHIFVNEQQVAVRGPLTCFGELALMYNSPRAATVSAVVDSVVWVVDRFTFRRIVTDLSSAKLSRYVNFLKQVKLLAPLAEYEREKIAEALEEVEFAPKAVIFRQGDDGDNMYIVREGEVIVTKDEEGESNEVARCVAGDYFGERALVKNESRAATVTAGAGGVQALKLDRATFALLLGPLEDILNDKVDQYDKPPEEGKQEDAPAKPQIAFEDLSVIGTLGKGSFGHVQLVKDPQQNTYALKAVSKAQIVQTGQQGHIMSEKRTMELMNHPFLIKLFATYQDKNRLYFLLEPSLGGELFSVLRAKSLFDEETARFYAASVVLAFEYMHNKDIIYRDLKPENLLLDEQGFLKVTDFGFAKDISNGRTWTLCGTPDYLAPEIVAGKGHGKGVDWWTLGVFIYEMLASYPPFYDEDPMKTYAKIMHGSITFPSHFSKEAVSLIKKLLHHKPTKRLGVVKGGAKLIKKHPWFKGFDFDQLVNRQMKPPIIPKIKSNMDISNFDQYPDEGDDRIEEYRDDGSGWADDF